MRDVIHKNLEQVHDNIKAACARSGRKPEDITLIAVSKTKPLGDLQEAYRCGERVFGENKVQDRTFAEK